MGGNAPGDFLSMDFDLKEWLLKGTVEALAKTEPAVYRDSHLGKHTSCWYNSFSKHLVGNYENWVFAQAVKDWCVGSYKAIFDNLKALGNEPSEKRQGRTIGRVANGIFWFRVDLKISEYNRLDLRVRTPEEMSPASSRD